MSVAELQKTIRQLNPTERRALAAVAARMVRGRKPARGRSLGVRAMLSVLGCARKVQPGKNSRLILSDLRGYDRAEL